jgi:hypothetical protein
MRVSKLQAFAMAVSLLALPALGQSIEHLAPTDVLDLRLGEPIAAQPGPFREYACGTNGGPPARALSGFEDFANCPVEPETGLREVTFRYDDELEYYALAMNLMPIADRFGGTRFGTFPVIVSVLISDDSMVHGYRVVTDDRVATRVRRVAYTMGILARARVPGQWSCVDLPLANGETPVGRSAVKQDCTGTSASGSHLLLKTRFFHRKGQTQFDQHSGKFREGLYESTARLEVFDAGWSKP